MNIHLIGIGGVGMAGLAVLLKNRGHTISGCDVHPGPRTDWLERQGIPVAAGHDPKHLDGVDQVIVTPAVHVDNPELVAAKTSGVRVRYRGEVLAELVSAAADSIAICGSHGKTTTATWIARLLIALGENVEWAIGGETGDFPVAGKEVVSDKVVSDRVVSDRVVSDRVVGDRVVSDKVVSDRVVGDRVVGDKVVSDRVVGDRVVGDRVVALTTNHSIALSPVLVVEADESDGTLAQYHARTLVVTNCEYDHADHFKTKADYLACYETAKRQACEVIEEPGTPFAVHEPWFEALPEHNRQNAMRAIAVARRRGHAREDILAAMPAIVGQLPDRRFQKIAAGVITDYAHHPTEMRCAVQMARAICTGTLRVLFQPHRYSRTQALLADFPAAFAGADEVVLCPTYAAFEDPLPGGDITDLHRACVAQGVAHVALAPTCADAWARVRPLLKPGDITLLLGAGDIIGLVPKIQKDLSVDQPTSI